MTNPTTSPKNQTALAEAETDMMQLLDKAQCDAIAVWLKFYGDAFAAQSPNCGRIVRENFRYAANRLEILGQGGSRLWDIREANS